MRFKRLLALLLAAALALSLLAGCGGGKNQSLSQMLLNLLDGQYQNVSVEIDSQLEADLRQAIRKAEAENAGDDDAVIRAALEKLVGSTVTFRNLGDGQQGDTTFDLVFYAGTDPDKAAQAAYSQWNIVFANVPDDGKYGTDLAMVQTDNGIWMLVKATVEKAGTEDKAEPVTLKSIAIAQNPTKTKYKDGVAFDPTGMKITATYSDGSTKTIDGTSTDVTFSPGTITDGTTSVTVFYGSKQTAVSVECITLDHISVTLNKLEYTVDDELTSSNVAIAAVYSDNITTEPIEPNNCSFTLDTTPITLPYKFSKGGNYTLTVTYDGKTSDPVNIHVTDQNGYHEEENNTYVVTGTDGLQNLYSSSQSDFTTAKSTLESPVTLGASWPETITFTGELNGNGNTITLTENRTQGLFNEIGEDGKVLNVDIEVSGTISGSGAVGGIAGTLRKGTVTGCSVTGGRISSSGSGSRGDVGGVVGWNSGGSVTACYSTGDVSGSYAGGVVGHNYNGGTVNDCYSTGTVSCGSDGGFAGGVVGRNSRSSSVTGCYHAGGEVSGVTAGGVVGENYDGGIVTACFSTNAVSSATGPAGGVVGWNLGGGTVTACYHAGSVSGDDAGGVVGYNYNDAFGSGTVNNCYWSGTPEKGIGDANESNPDTTTEITEDNANTAWDALVDAMKVEGYTLKGSWTNPSFE